MLQVPRCLLSRTSHQLRLRNKHPHHSSHTANDPRSSGCPLAGNSQLRSRRIPSQHGLRHSMLLIKLHLPGHVRRAPTAAVPRSCPPLSMTLRLRPTTLRGHIARTLLLKTLIRRRVPMPAGPLASQLFHPHPPQRPRYQVLRLNLALLPGSPHTPPINLIITPLHHSPRSLRMVGMTVTMTRHPPLLDRLPSRLSDHRR